MLYAASLAGVCAASQPLLHGVVQFWQHCAPHHRDCGIHADALSLQQGGHALPESCWPNFVPYACDSGASHRV